MRQSSNEMIMFKSTATMQAAFTAAATDIVTLNSHGFSTGDKVRVTTSGADLPSGLAINTDYYVERIDANTFYLSTRPGGSQDGRVNIADAGTGTHTMHLKSRVIDVEDYEHIMLSLHTDNSANFTVKLQGSNQDDVNFENAASATNRWDYIQNVDLEDAANLDGDTGFAPTGTDDNREWEVNVNGFKWICLDVTSWTAGNLDARVTAYK